MNFAVRRELKRTFEGRATTKLNRWEDRNPDRLPETERAIGDGDLGRLRQTPALEIEQRADCFRQAEHPIIAGRVSSRQESGHRRGLAQSGAARAVNAMQLGSVGEWRLTATSTAAIRNVRFVGSRHAQTSQMRK
jgi:hypothetical protein